MELYAGVSDKKISGGRIKILIRIKEGMSDTKGHSFLGVGKTGKRITQVQSLWYNVPV